jgi:hypothetical protein
MNRCALLAALVVTTSVIAQTSWPTAYVSMGTMCPQFRPSTTAPRVESVPAKA